MIGYTKASSNGFPKAVDLASPTHRLVGAMEPVGSIASISFDEVQEGVNPGSGGRVEVLGDVMGGFPLVIFAEPQSLEGFRQDLWWGGGA